MKYNNNCQEGKRGLTPQKEKKTYGKINKTKLNQF